MGPMTDSPNPDNVQYFYDSLAGGYDAMTGFTSRFEKEEPFFKTLVDRYGITSGVDAGAGTGFHSLLLAQLGVAVTAIDLSPRMLAVLSEHAAAMGLKVRAIAGELSALPKSLSASVDAIFAMGNTLAHFLTPQAVADVLAAFKASLRPGGVLCAQLLNYSRILAVRENVINIKEADGIRFTRRYDYVGNLIRFTIVREDLTGRRPPESESVDLYPLVETEVVAALNAAGFARIETFGGLSMEPYDAGVSKDLVVLAFSHPLS
jgi:SAM-dependent methyltransferase